MSVFPQYTLNDIYSMTLDQVRLWHWLAAKQRKQQSEWIAGATAQVISRMFAGPT